MKLHHFLICSISILLSTCAYDTIQIEDCSQQTIILSVDEVQSTLCGTSQGIIKVSLDALESESFSYSINGIDFQENNVFTDLAAGNYTITARSAAGCLTSIDTTITNETNVVLSIITNDSGCGSNNGEIQASTTEAGFTFSIDGVNFQNSGNFTGLNMGSYTVTARNSEGCDISQIVKISSGISFENTVSEIINTNCAIANCHGSGGSNSIKFLTLGDIKQRAGKIKTRVNNKSMPPGDRSITQQEIDQISCWVDDGALDN